VSPPKHSEDRESFARQFTPNLRPRLKRGAKTQFAYQTRQTNSKARLAVARIALDQKVVDATAGGRLTVWTALARNVHLRDRAGSDSGQCCPAYSPILWATENGSDLVKLDPADGLALDLSVGHAAIIVSLPAGEYLCSGDEVRHDGTSALRCCGAGSCPKACPISIVIQL